MLRIREEQVAVFQQAALRNFEDRMLAHLRDFAPPNLVGFGATESCK